MPYNPEIHHRRSIRLRGYDYSQAGAYFITICINHRQPLLGAIADGIMYPNPAGEMVQTIWEELPFHYSNLELDIFVLMPNHIHGIIVLKSLQTQPVMKLGEIIHRFKSFTTAKYRHAVNQEQWQPFIGRLWQRNYYEHIIRDRKSYDLCRQYIINNPSSWESDRLYPEKEK
jgi:putative transposase